MSPDRLTDAHREAMEAAWQVEAAECTKGVRPDLVEQVRAYRRPWFEAGFLAALSREDEGLETYDAEADKRPFTELTFGQQMMRERASYKRQLDIVDRELRWDGTGRGRIESIRLLARGNQHLPPPGEDEGLREALERVAEIGDVMDSHRMTDAERAGYAKRLARAALAASPVASRGVERLRKAGVEAAMRAAYNREPQWTGGGERRRAKTYEECYGCSPLEKLDDRAEMEASIRAYLAASPVASREVEGRRDAIDTLIDLGFEVRVDERVPRGVVVVCSGPAPSPSRESE